MPLSENDLRDVQGRVLRMFMDTIATFQLIEQNADAIYGDRAARVRAAINEYLDDFLKNTSRSGEMHPEQLIYEAPRQNFQRAGLYGAQLDIKEKQVTVANASLREQLVGGVRRFFNKPFRKWVEHHQQFPGQSGCRHGPGRSAQGTQGLPAGRVAGRRRNLMTGPVNGQATRCPR